MTTTTATVGGAWCDAYDTQQILPFGSPEMVRQHVRETVAAFRADGGYIFAPSQILGPDIPLENIVAMYEEIRGGRVQFNEK